uniref:Uncharacterized protein n=1 Tax=Arion vulgaris TaxID=1028688 RepID=A0A0B7AP38_9EUPU
MYAFGTCMSIPKKAQTLNILKGTLMRYSWKNAENKNTAVDAANLEKFLLSKGLYKCLEAKRCTGIFQFCQNSETVSAFHQSL